ncbi:MAG: repressor LexA [Lachnospiraceae bacterium]|nr:repressor LexA [Lachnospiraceae bacterium]
MRSKSKELMVKIRDFAEKFTLENSRTPSTAEIGVALGISKTTAFKYLKEMHQLGMVTYEGGVLHTRVTNKMNCQNVNIPIAGMIPCGPPEEQIENTDEYLSLPKSLLGEGEFFILRASGDSMIDAGIDSGDLVIVRRQIEAEPGDIVAALVDGGSTLKRLSFNETSRCYLLLPENHEKNYSPIEGRDGSIQGVAVKVLKNL